MIFLLLGLCFGGYIDDYKPESTDEVCRNYPKFLIGKDVGAFTIQKKVSCVNSTQLPCLLNKTETNPMAIFTVKVGPATFQNRTLRYSQCEKIEIEREELSTDRRTLNYYQLTRFKSRFQKDKDAQIVLHLVVKKMQEDNPEKFYFLRNCDYNDSIPNCDWNQVSHVEEIHLKEWFFFGETRYPTHLLVKMLQQFKKSSLPEILSNQTREIYQKNVERFITLIFPDVEIGAKADIVHKRSENEVLFTCLEWICGCYRRNETLCVCGQIPKLTLSQIFKIGSFGSIL